MQGHVNFLPAFHLHHKPAEHNVSVGRGVWRAQNSANTPATPRSLVLRRQALHGMGRGSSCSTPAKIWLCPERDAMQAPVSQKKLICPGFACGSTGEELATPEHLWVKSLLWTLWMSLFSYDHLGGSSRTAHTAKAACFLLHCSIVHS